jgi:hypothetical protein
VNSLGYRPCLLHRRNKQCHKEHASALSRSPFYRRPLSFLLSYLFSPLNRRSLYA